MSQESFIRLEDERLLTGRGRFVANRSLPGELHAFFLRSDRPHARILSIDASAALAMPGVRAVLTSRDIQAAGIGALPTLLPVQHDDGRPLAVPFRPVLAQDKVRFVGEALACVVADSFHQAQDAAESLLVEYEDLPHVIEAVDALAPGAPQLHDSLPGNLLYDLTSGRPKEVDQAFKAAHKVVRLSLHNQRVVGNPMEPRAALGAYDAPAGRYVLHSCTQGVNGLRAQICRCMGIADHEIAVHAFDVGGAFGARSALYPEYVVLMLAARQLGRPVRWTATRSETFLSDEHGRDVHSQGELALDSAGRFLAMRFSFVGNLGAYSSNAQPFTTSRVAICMSGVYDVPIASSRVRLAATNTSPTGPYRGSSRPVMSSIIERLVEKAAREMQMDPAALRRMNMIPRDRFPYTQANGMVYDCGDPIGVLDDALAASSWGDAQAFAQRRAQARTEGRLLGRGMACFIESTGQGAAPHDQVQWRFGSDGTVAMYTAAHAAGQSHETTYALIASRILGLPLERFTLKQGDDAVRLVGNGTSGSRSLQGVGSVVLVGAQEIVKKGMALAAARLEAAEEDLRFADGAYRVAGTDHAITMEDLARSFAGVQPHPLDTLAQWKIGTTFPIGAHLAEVEIEEATGLCRILSYVACDDAGNVVNHSAVEGQMHGGIAQGAGQVFGEHAVYDRQTGQLLTGSFMDYPMPKAGIVRGLTLLEHPVPTQTNPLGAKGVGESGVSGSLPALMNAITDALAQVGVEEFDMPASPARLWQAIEAARAGQPRAMAISQEPR